jgi:hypothetical protein
VLVGVAAMVMAFDSRSLLRRIAAPGRLRLPSASWLPGPSAAVADAVLVALLVAGAALAVGVLARLAATGCAVLAVAPMAIDHQAYSNHGVLLAALGALLAVAEPQRPSRRARGACGGRHVRSPPGRCSSSRRRSPRCTGGQPSRSSTSRT